MCGKAMLGDYYGSVVSIFAGGDALRPQGRLASHTDGLATEHNLSPPM